MTRADAALEQLVAAMRDAEPACQGDGRFILDDQPAEALADICHRCPLSAACRDYAATARPIDGIWAGRRWNKKPRQGKETA